MSINWTPWKLLFAIVFAAVTFALLYPVKGQQHSNPWLMTWINHGCCVTSDCCFEITEQDVQSLGNLAWRIKASGQVLPQTGFSPDGRWYRCACDSINGKWVVHPTALTRCLYVPRFGS